MTLTDEELVRLEARTPRHDGLCGANPMMDDGPCGCYEQLIDRLLATLRAERDEVKRLREIANLADQATLAYGNSKGPLIPAMERLGAALSNPRDIS